IFQVKTAYYLKGGQHRSAGVLRDNIIRLLDKRQGYGTAPVIFEPSKRVYNSDGVLVSARRTPQSLTTRPSPSPTHGSWRTVCGTSCFRGGSHITTSRGATYVAHFRGRQAVLWAPVGWHHGIAAVSVEGGRPAYIDTYSSRASCPRPIFTTAKLAPRHDTISVRVTGGRNQAFRGAAVSVDALPSAR
ncbi:hypothetical protein ACFV2N_48360, partial [Streptomyces sp. NPDC059680]